VSDKQLFSRDLLFTITFILYHSQYSFLFCDNSKNFIKHKQKAHIYLRGKIERLLIKKNYIIMVSKLSQQIKNYSVILDYK
jgi:hypothetical protein